MASSPTLQTTDEEDEEHDELNRHFQREYRKEGASTSPKSTTKDRDGFFARFSGKSLEVQKKKNAKLERELNALKAELEHEKQKRFKQRRELHVIIKECNNIQVGDGNTMKVLKYDTDNDDPIPLIKQLIKKTAEANEEIVHKLTISENQLTNNSKYLKKIHTVVLQLGENGSASTKQQMMEQLKDMVEISTETDAFATIEKAFESLKLKEDMKMFEDLTAKAKRGIRIIVYKFGSMTKQEFANILGLKVQKQSCTGEQLIDETICAAIILHWLKIPNNNVYKLLGILKGYESQLIQESQQDLYELTFAKQYESSEKDVHITPESSSVSSLQRSRLFGDSVLSLRSNRSDVCDSLELIERHASETLQKTANRPDVKPDMEALLCALYALQMDNTRTLHAIEETINAKDTKEYTNDSNKKPSENHVSATDDKKMRDDVTTEEYV